MNTRRNFLKFLAVSPVALAVSGTALAVFSDDWGQIVDRPHVFPPAPHMLSPAIHHDPNSELGRLVADARARNMNEAVQSLLRHADQMASIKNQILAKQLTLTV